MKVSYRRELDRNYMILEQENFQDFFEVQMLIGNRIPGLLECKVNLVDGNGAFCYEITSKQSLKLMLERQRLSAKEFLHFLESLLDAVRICREYLLDSRRLLLRPEQIYLDPDSWTFSFCYFPFYEEELHGEVLNLAEYFLECLERRDAKAVSLGYEFYRIAGQENLSLEQMLEKGREERTEEEESGRKQAEQKEACRGKSARRRLRLLFWSGIGPGSWFCGAGTRPIPA